MIIKQIKACALRAHWDTNTWAASPFSPTCLRPLFGRYVPKDNDPQ